MESRPFFANSGQAPRQNQRFIASEIRSLIIEQYLNGVSPTLWLDADQIRRRQRLLYLLLFIPRAIHDEVKALDLFCEPTRAPRVQTLTNTGGVAEQVIFLGTI